MTGGEGGSWTKYPDPAVLLPLLAFLSHLALWCYVQSHLNFMISYSLCVRYFKHSCLPCLADGIKHHPLYNDDEDVQSDYRVAFFLLAVLSALSA